MNANTNERKDVMSKTKAPSKRAAKKQAAPLEWTAKEYSPRHRWWWFIVIALVGLYLTLLLLFAGNWSAAALALVITLSLIVFGLTRPGEWHYRLDDDKLVVEGTARTRSIRIEWKLADQAAFTRELIQRRNAEPFELLVLLGRGRLAWPHDVYLTGDPATDEHIVNRLEKTVPRSEAAPFHSASRNLQVLARWLRIS